MSAILGVWAEFLIMDRQYGQWEGAVTSLPPPSAAEKETRVTSSKMVDAGVNQSTRAASRVVGEPGEQTGVQNPTLMDTGVRLISRERGDRRVRIRGGNGVGLGN